MKVISPLSFIAFFLWSIRCKDNLQKETVFFTVNTQIQFINYSSSSNPTRASYSGQMDGSRKTSEKRVENLGFQTRRQMFLIFILIKQENHMTINNFIDNK